MIGIGKYIRHTLAWLAGVTVTALVGWLEPLGIRITAEDVAVLEGGVTVVGLILTGVVYSLAEKWLKRFQWLDLEGWADRLQTHRQALDARHHSRVAP